MGELWLDGNKVASSKEVSSKDGIYKEDIIIAGQMGTDTKYMGYKEKVQ